MRMSEKIKYRKKSTNKKFNEIPPHFQQNSYYPKTRDWPGVVAPVYNSSIHDVGKRITARSRAA